MFFCVSETLIVGIKFDTVCISIEFPFDVEASVAVFSNRYEGKHICVFVMS